ncbi:unnamed protein product (macronuclear) [Paramecium tetraurelia]|uniref:Uncharacterized protein n=1 Tax=Paramecium tetraurelia TaxID=5888 RepID=A0BGM2_PARTE|nr:uncharacterized protein GSPATT00028724001 [Paramecium tetraurelia]CAK57689.1 unnamed protein product [Paramecium tetraurelia]|eukprot:XP_001425087.1 hypothetical protein (macronuclear) [Paramecium tetraurelia strain d4-2]
MNVAEIGELKKQLTKALTENAHLMQKNQLLELKLKETEERNCNIQKMNGTIMHVLNDLNVQNNRPSTEILKQQDQFNMKLMQCQKRIESYESQIKNLQTQLQEALISKNEQTQRITQLQEHDSQLLKQIGALESSVKTLTGQLQLQSKQTQEFSQQLEDVEFESQKAKFSQSVKIEELNEENMKLKEELKSLMGQYLRKTSSSMQSSMPASPQNVKLLPAPPQTTTTPISKKQTPKKRTTTISQWKK